MKQIIYPTYNEPMAGRVLIADPFLADSNFSRAVVLICEFGEEGSLGFILNRPTQLSLPQLLPEQILPDIPVYQGGPVQLDTLHMLHQLDEIHDGKKILDGVYWGGAFDQLKDFHDDDVQVHEQCRLFLGYSGWSPGQLEEEIKEGTWIISDTSADLLFHTAPEKLWEASINALGGEYRWISKAPLNPQLN